MPVPYPSPASGKSADCPDHARHVYQCGDCDVYECCDCKHPVDPADVTVIKTKGHVCAYCWTSSRYWADGRVRQLMIGSRPLAVLYTDH